jgi:hypothetical protein
MMSIKPQQIKRLTQIIVPKPLDWALYAAGLIVACLARTGLRGLRSLLQRGAGNEDCWERKERRWQRQY